MRYLTSDLQKRMQFFNIAHEGMTLQGLVNQWVDIGHPRDIFADFYREIEFQKSIFAGENSLSEIEMDIVILHSLISDLVHDAAGLEFGIRRGGINNIEAYSKSKLDRIIEILGVTGPLYLHKIMLKARKVLEIKDEKIGTKEKQRLNARIKLKYKSPSKGLDEILQIDKFLVICVAC